MGAIVVALEVAGTGGNRQGKARSRRKPAVDVSCQTVLPEEKKIKDIKKKAYLSMVTRWRRYRVRLGREMAVVGSVVGGVGAVPLREWFVVLVVGVLEKKEVYLQVWGWGVATVVRKAGSGDQPPTVPW